MGSPHTTMSPAPTLSERLARGLRLGGAALEGLAEIDPIDRRDRLTTLLTIYDLHTAPLDRIGAVPGRLARPAQARTGSQLLGRDGPSRPRRRPHRTAPRHGGRPAGSGRPPAGPAGGSAGVSRPRWAVRLQPLAPARDGVRPRAD